MRVGAREAMFSLFWLFVHDPPEKKYGGHPFDEGLLCRRLNERLSDLFDLGKLVHLELRHECGLGRWQLAFEEPKDEDLVYYQAGRHVRDAEAVKADMLESGVPEAAIEALVKLDAQSVFLDP
jgi:hypothetical protein